MDVIIREEQLILGHAKLLERFYHLTATQCKT